MGSSPGPSGILQLPLRGARGVRAEGLLATVTAVRPTTARSAADWSLWALAYYIFSFRNAGSGSRLVFVGSRRFYG